MATKQASTDRDLTAALARDREAALKLVPVSRETLDRIDAFVTLLMQWQATTNLIASSTMHELWTRHIADSLQLLRIAAPKGTWVDLGSGGGFPGVVIACAIPPGDGEVHLVERNGKKAAFLREALRVTRAAGRVHHQEITDFVDSFSCAPDYIIARAVAPLKVLIDLSAPLIQRGAKALLLKGQDVGAELTEATKYWTIRHNLHPSLTSKDSFVVEILGLEQRGSARPKKS